MISAPRGTLESGYEGNATLGGRTRKFIPVMVTIDAIDSGPEPLWDSVCEGVRRGSRKKNTADRLRD
jgi:hypothetical protein